MSKGYVLVAAKDYHYLELAVSAACSLRVNDDKPIALLISGGLRVPRKYLDLFDWVIAFDPPAPYDGDFLRRFVLEDYTPFEKAMHVDADCLLIGRGIQSFWERFDSAPFGVLAQFQTSGKCYAGTTDIDQIVQNGISPGVYVTNWGVFYYHNTGDNEIMRRGRELIRQHIAKERDIPLTYFSRTGQLSDEPIWGIALAQSGIKVPGLDYGNLLQVTSPSTSNYVFDYAHHSFSVQKGGLPNVRGQFYHYAAMNPLDGYLEGVVYYRNILRTPLPAINTVNGDRLPAEEWTREIKTAVGVMQSAGKATFRFVE